MAVLKAPITDDAMPRVASLRLHGERREIRHDQHEQKERRRHQKKEQEKDRGMT